MRLGCKEGEEDFGNRIARDSSPVVFDENLHIAPFIHGIDGNRYYPIYTQCFDSVDDQIEEGLAHQRRIAHNDRRSRSNKAHLVIAGPAALNVTQNVVE